MLIHWIWFAELPSVTLRVKLQLLEHFSDPEDIYRTERFKQFSGITPDLEAALSNKDLAPANKILADCKREQISVLTMQDAGYPTRLRNTSAPPMVLYYKGVIPDFDGQPVIGVVGTRKASAYGMQNAVEMARQITACGGLVVSGGAAGIDTAALQGALSIGGQCVAIFGCGVDIAYPKKNQLLFKQISENGCLISEYPPGTEPLPWHFPERNRIISGLSNGVLVVEAPKNSGALITASDAFSQGRDVFVVPGNIGVAVCEGSNGLLLECASAALSGWDVMREYEGVYPCVEKRTCIPLAPKREPDLRVAQAIMPFPDAPNDKKDIDNSGSDAYSDRERLPEELDPFSRKLVENLGPEPIPVDELIAMVQEAPDRVLGALTMLALAGIVENHPGRLISVRR